MATRKKGDLDGLATARVRFAYVFGALIVGLVLNGALQRIPIDVTVLGLLIGLWTANAGVTAITAAFARLMKGDDE